MKHRAGFRSQKLVLQERPTLNSCLLYPTVSHSSFKLISFHRPLNSDFFLSPCTEFAEFCSRAKRSSAPAEQTACSLGWEEKHSVGRWLFGEEGTSFYQSEELIDTINGMKDKSLFKKKSTGFGTPTGYGVKEQHVGR